MKLEAIIEAILFTKGEPVSVKSLSKILEKEEGEVENALQSLSLSLGERGIRLLQKENKVMLATAPEAGEIINSLIKDEYDTKIGQAGVETLAIVIYRGPVSRADIDYIRGVNSAFILRNLLIRGLVERVSNPRDRRSFIYKPTFKLLQYMGIEKLEDLPEYQNLNDKITTSLEEKNNDKTNG